MAPQDVDLSFASGPWRRLVLVRPASVPSAPGASSGRDRQRAGAKDTPLRIARRHFEVCVFSHLAAELRSGDVCVTGADVHADYRDQLLPWDACAPQVAAYCRELGFPETADGFVAHLQRWLTDTAEAVDAGYPDNGQVTITPEGEPVLKRPPRREARPSAQALEAALLERLPERTLLDLLCNVDDWTRWTRHFGPLSGAEPKLEDPTARYLLTTFAYGCNLGPAQAARHMRGLATAHMLSFVNRRHVSVTSLNAALRDLVNAYHRCGLPTLWGDGTAAAADGTKYDVAENNLVAEYHIRYGGYGGIAYHHVADTYVALFSHFIPCGVWEAVYLIEGLLQNTSDVQPDTVHTDTQGQSAPVFGLAYLLGIQLMPRIRNWKDLRFYRPSKEVRYQSTGTSWPPTGPTCSGSPCPSRPAPSPRRCCCTSWAPTAARTGSTRRSVNWGGWSAPCSSSGTWRTSACASRSRPPPTRRRPTTASPSGSSSAATASSPTTTPRSRRSASSTTTSSPTPRSCTRWST
jgi:hypothetical protein